MKVKTGHKADSSFAFESARRTALTRAWDGLLHCALRQRLTSTAIYILKTYTYRYVKVLVCMRLLLDASITTCAGCAGDAWLSLDL